MIATEIFIVSKTTQGCRGPLGYGAGQGEVGVLAPYVLLQLHPCNSGKQGWKTEHLAVPAMHGQLCTKHCSEWLVKLCVLETRFAQRSRAALAKVSPLLEGVSLKT